MRAAFSGRDSPRPRRRRRGCVESLIRRRADERRTGQARAAWVVSGPAARRAPPERRGIAVRRKAWSEGMTTMGAMTDRTGQGLVEYALLLLLIAVAAVAAVSLLAPQLGAVFNRITASLVI
jgi:Flp pilus assembly pilin Flp